MPILIADPSRMLKRLDYVESGARRARLAHHKRRIAQGLDGHTGIDRDLVVSVLGLELRANGIMEAPTSADVDYAIRFGGFLR